MNNFLVEMQNYFDAEKSECWLFLGIGVFGFLFSIFSILKGNEILKSMAYPVLTIALIQIIVGGTVLVRTDSQVAELKSYYNQSPKIFVEKELPRIEKVNFWFDIYKEIEIGLIAAGCACIAIGSSNGYLKMSGIGIGLLIQSSIMLILDLFAELRADAYTDLIKKLTI